MAEVIILMLGLPSPAKVALQELFQASRNAFMYAIVERRT